MIINLETLYKFVYLSIKFGTINNYYYYTCYYFVFITSITTVRLRMGACMHCRIQIVVMSG